MKQPKTALTHYTKEKYLLAFLLGFGCIFICLLPFMITNHGYFVYTGDYNAQQIPFYNLANDTVRNGQFGWNWYTDLGTDFMTSYSFYLFGSPFFWLTTILPRALVTYSMPVLIGIKHGLASLTAYAYIRRFVKNKNAAVIGGLLYACSGFQSYNVFFNHFQDVTAFFPLMLIAMEEYLTNHRKGVFAVIAAFMALLNYYFFAGQAVFLVLYYIFRSMSSDYRHTWKKFAGIAFEAAVGTMIAAAFLIPTALAISGNQRLTEHTYGADTVIYQDSTLIPRIIQSFFMVPDAPSKPNLFFSEYGKWASIGGYFPLFSMAGVAAFMRKRKNHWASKLSVCCIIFAFIPALNSLFQAANAYYYARWFYMPILIFAMMTAETLDEDEADLDFGWNFCAVMVGIFVILGCVPTTTGDSKPLFFMLPMYTALYWITIGISVAGLIASKILFNRKKAHRSYLKAAICLTAAASVGCFFTHLLDIGNTVSDAREYADIVINGEDDVYEKVSDDNFFRISISENNDNYSMLWKLPNIDAFHSVVNTSIMDFYNEIGVERNVASRPDISHYTLRGLLSVKQHYRYYNSSLITPYSELKATDEKAKATEKAIAKAFGGTLDYSNSIVPDEMPGFEYVGENGSYEIYENSLYIPMGFTYDEYVNENSFAEYDIEEDQEKENLKKEKMLIKALILNDEQAEKYSDIITEYKGDMELTKDDYVEACKERKKYSSSEFSFDSHSFRSKITLDKPQLVFYSVPYSEGWTAEVNGKAVDVEKVSYGFMAVRAEAGENSIVFRYKTPGLGTGIIVSIAGIILLAGYLIICRIFKNKNTESGHSHFYEYNSTHKVSASEDYIRSLTEKD